MARNLFMHRLGVVAILTAVPAFAAQTAAAAESELVVIVTPYLTTPTKQNQSQDNPVDANSFQPGAVPLKRASPNGPSSNSGAVNK
jgi:hypothetical protein